MVFANDSIVILDLATLDTVATTPHGIFPIWIPNSLSILYDDRAGQIMKYDIGDEVSKVFGEGGPRGAFGPMDISPDGRIVLFNNYSVEDNFYHIWRMDIDGSNARRFLAW